MKKKGSKTCFIYILFLIFNFLTPYWCSNIDGYRWESCMSLFSVELIDFRIPTTSFLPFNDCPRASKTFLHRVSSEKTAGLYSVSRIFSLHKISIEYKILFTCSSWPCELWRGWWVYRPRCLPVAAGPVNCDEGDEYTDQNVYL